MTFIAFDDGKPVMRGGKVGTGQGCCCGNCTPCSRCLFGCLDVTLAGFAGSEGAGCDECENLNGTYTLVRGIGVPPSLSVRVESSSGSGAVLTATLEFNKSTGTYSVSGVTVNKAGSGYSPDVSLSYTVADGVVACGDPPTLAVTTARAQPTLAALVPSADFTPPSGSGASLQASFVPVNTTPGAETWGLGPVTVVSGGSNYEDGTIVQVKAGSETKVITHAFPSIRVDHAQPVVDQFTVKTDAGAGAVFTPTWKIDQERFDFWTGLNAGYDGRWWYIESLAITNGGSGYQVGDSIGYTLTGTNRNGTNGSTTGYEFLTSVDAVSGTGAITAINTTSLGPGVQTSHYKTNGIIQSVFVGPPGEYYKLGGITSATVTNPGAIWPISSTGGTSPGSPGTSGSLCEYSLCEPTVCTYGGETKCRRVSLLIGDEENVLTVTLDGAQLLRATTPAAGTKCSALEFSPEMVTSACETVGSITVEAGECTGPPAEDSCCRGACCVDGACDPTKATAEQCAAAGGQWHQGRGCNDPCWCCLYRYICFEEVLIAKEGSWPRIQEGDSPPWSNDIDDIPTEQPPGTLFVWALSDEPPFGNIYGCAGTPGIKMYANGSGETLPDGPCGEPGNYRFILQVYYRARIVDSCDECSGVEQEWEYPGGRVFCCDNDGNYHPNVTSCEDCPGWSPENINPARCWTTQGELLSARAGMSCSPLTQYSCANQIPPGIPWSSCLEAAGISICANPFP